MSPFNNIQVKIGELVRDANALMRVNICEIVHDIANFGVKTIKINVLEMYQL